MSRCLDADAEVVEYAIRLESLFAQLEKSRNSFQRAGNHIKGYENVQKKFQTHRINNQVCYNANLFWACNLHWQRRAVAFVWAVGDPFLSEIEPAE